MKGKIEIELDDELKRLGAPTFDEFCSNRDKWLGRSDDVLSRADSGTSMFRDSVNRHVYEIEGHRTQKLEEVQRIAADYGIPLQELDYKPEIIPISGDKCDVLVKFVPKHIRDKRNAW